MLAPIPILHDPNLLPALRELFSQHPAMMQSGYDTLGRALFVLRYLPYRPEPVAVEAALETLAVEGEVLA
jgi:hypothetical protein